jgi:putative FmdB family regulatory protein
MPLYEYECEDCGVFTGFRSMSQASEPLACECGVLSARILSVPKLAVMEKSQRTAHERNEQSAHHPNFKTRSSCGCAGAHTCNSNGGVKMDAKTGQPALQMQTKKTARPWMLSH